MSGRFERVFGAEPKPVIAMVHLPPLPGTPLYDEKAGVKGLVDAVACDLEILLEQEVDAVMFCNEGDRPYSLKADFEGISVMTRVVTTSTFRKLRTRTCSRSAAELAALMAVAIRPRSSSMIWSF